MSSVVYLMSGQPHLPYLATSLLTLRQWWSGDVIVCAWPESIAIASKIVSDRDIRAQAQMVDPAFRGKNDQFLHKIKLMQSFETGPNLYLDADTLICGNLDKLFLAANRYGFAATQFGDWTTDGGVVKNRISRLAEFEEIDTDLVYRVTNETFPSVNGGVFCCEPTSPVLRVWHDWSWAAKSIFICDECVLHLMVPMFEISDNIFVMDGRYNSSPKFETTIRDVVIWHGHGDCFTRPDKSSRGCDMWRYVFDECRRRNTGGINQWWGMCGNRFLNKMMGAAA